MHHNIEFQIAGWLCMCWHSGIWEGERLIELWKELRGVKVYEEVRESIEI